MSIRIDIWSDMVCPYCYIGKKRLEHVAAEEGIELEMHWHSYELEPKGAQQYDIPLTQILAQRYGMTIEQAIQTEIRTAKAAAEEGIDFRWQQAKPGNTFNMHRLMHFAQSVDLADELGERFMHAYFTEGQAVGDVKVVAKLAIEAGLHEQEVWEILNSDRYAQEVREDERVAQRELNVRGVPFIVFDKKVAMPGAMPRETFRETLRKVAAEHPMPQPLNAATSEACEDGVCAIPNQT